MVEDAIAGYVASLKKHGESLPVGFEQAETGHDQENSV